MSGARPAPGEGAPPSEPQPEFDPALVGARAPLDDLTFEEILAALESVTNRMASGEIGIEAATDLYEQAEILHGAAEARLHAVEARIARLAPRGAP